MKYDAKYLKKILLNSRFDKINIIFDYFAEIKIYIRGIGSKYLFISFSPSRPFLVIANDAFPLRLKSRTSFAKGVKNVAEGMLFSSLSSKNGVVKLKLERFKSSQAVYLFVGGGKFFVEDEDGAKIYAYDGFLGEEVEEIEKNKNYDLTYDNELLFLELQQLFYEEVRRKIGRVYRKKFKKVNKTLSKIRVDVEKFDNFTEQFKRGDVLKSQLYNVKKGMDQVELDDWSSGVSSKIIIDLNPALSPTDNLALIYKKAAKSKRGLNKAKDRLIVVEKDRKMLGDFLDKLEASSFEELLVLFKQEIEIFEKPIRLDKKREKSDVSKTFWSFEYENYIIYIGKSAKGNEFLSFKKANGNDLWFHAHNYPGSHVILKRKSKNYKCVPADWNLAATFALYHSKAPFPGKEEVVYTEAKNLGRIPSAPPGTVRRSAGKVLQVFVDEDAMKKIKNQAV